MSQPISVCHPPERRYQAVLTALPVAARRHLLYAKNHRRPLRLAAPRRFSEKINWRIVHDRRELLETTCDKLRTKQEGIRHGARVPTYWSGRRLDELADVELPARWVLKPNHRTGLVYLGRGRPDVRVLEQTTLGWLIESQWRVYGEWAYCRAEPRFLIEEWLGGLDGCPPDYKVFVFDGTPTVIQVDRGRFGEHTRRFYRRLDAPRRRLHLPGRRHRASPGRAAGDAGDRTTARNRVRLHPRRSLPARGRGLPG